jgi:hypothetical protein
MMDNIDLYRYSTPVPGTNQSFTEDIGAEKIVRHQKYIQSLLSEEWKSSDNPKRLYPAYNFPSELFSKALVGKSVVPAGMELQLRTDGAVLLEYN